MLHPLILAITIIGKSEDSISDREIDVARGKGLASMLTLNVQKDLSQADFLTLYGLATHPLLQYHPEHVLSCS